MKKFWLSLLLFPIFGIISSPDGDGGVSDGETAKNNENTDPPKTKNEDTKPPIEEKKPKETTFEKMLELAKENVKQQEAIKLKEMEKKLKELMEENESLKKEKVDPDQLLKEERNKFLKAIEIEKKSLYKERNGIQQQLEEERFARKLLEISEQKPHQKEKITQLMEAGVLKNEQDYVLLVESNDSELKELYERRNFDAENNMGGNVFGDYKVPKKSEKASKYQDKINEAKEKAFRKYGLVKK